MNIAIFASGTGSNACKIMEHFENHPSIRIALVISNKSDAGVLEAATRFGVPTKVILGREWREKDLVTNILENFNINFVVLAGFLLLVPRYLVERYRGHMVNIHPALLPDFGGKGMYGMNVHRAVKASGKTESGMTIHFVNERFDEGEILFQGKCTLGIDDTPEEIGHKVLALEHQYFAPVIEQVILDLKQSN